MPLPEEPKLPVADIIAEACWLPWARRHAFLKALLVPSIAILAVQMWTWRAGALPVAASVLVTIVQGVLWILFAVACHRLVLLGLQEREVPVVPGWGWRETRFLGCVLVITAVTWGAFAAIVVTFGVVLAAVSTAMFEASQAYVGGLVGIFFLARMGPVLPAAAIAAPIDFRETWHKTRSNTWRLMVIVGALPWIFGSISGLLSGSEPGIVREVAATAVGIIFLAVEISALSVSYRRLNSRR